MKSNSTKIRHLIFLVSALICLFTNNSQAQFIRLLYVYPDSSVACSLKDSKGYPITNNNIELRNANHHVVASTSTDSNGDFLFNVQIRDAYDFYLNLSDRVILMKDLIILKETEQEGETLSINLRTKIETPHNKLNNEQIRRMPLNNMNDLINTLDGQGALSR